MACFETDMYLERLSKTTEILMETVGNVNEVQTARGDNTEASFEVGRIQYWIHRKIVRNNKPINSVIIMSCVD